MYNTWKPSKPTLSKLHKIHTTTRQHDNSRKWAKAFSKQGFHNPLCQFMLRMTWFCMLYRPLVTTTSRNQPTNTIYNLGFCTLYRQLVRNQSTKTIYNLDSFPACGIHTGQVVKLMSFDIATCHNSCSSWLLLMPYNLAHCRLQTLSHVLALQRLVGSVHMSCSPPWVPHLMPGVILSPHIAQVCQAPLLSQHTAQVCQATLSACIYVTNWTKLAKLPSQLISIALLANVC